MGSLPWKGRYWLWLVPRGHRHLVVLGRIVSFGQQEKSWVTSCLVKSWERVLIPLPYTHSALSFL